MNLSLETTRLDEIMAIAGAIAERKKAMPILANVRLEAKNNELEIVASDLNVSICGRLAADVTEPGAVSVDAKVFADIIHQLPEQRVSLSVQKGYRVDIKSGASTFKVNGCSGEEFPEIPGFSVAATTSIDSALLKELFEHTVYAVSTDETRYNITGVYVEPVTLGSKSSGLRMVGTDGHRLAMIEKDTVGEYIANPVIVPRKGVLELIKVLDRARSFQQKSAQGTEESQVHLGTAPEFFCVTAGSVTLAIRLLEGQYPDYRQVIPQQVKTTIEVPVADLSAAVRRVSLLSSDKSRAVNMKLSAGTLSLTSASPEFGEAADTLTVDQTGDDISIAFSAKYLLDLLTALSSRDKVIARLDGPLAPGLFLAKDSEQYVNVLMPMRFT
jgi:DNA polymerase-3 subunit beta